MTFFCIADKESSIGFRLAGIETREVSGRSDSLEALEVALAAENVGIILVTEKIAVFLREELDKLIYASQSPLILELPSRGPLKKRKATAEFLKDLVGVGI